MNAPGCEPAGVACWWVRTVHGRPDGSSGDARSSRQDRRVLGTGCKCGSELRQRVADAHDAPSEQVEFGSRIIANRDVEDQVQLVEPPFQAGRRRVLGCQERVELGNGAPSRGGSGSSGASGCHAPDRQRTVHLAGRVLRPRGNGRVPGASVPAGMAVGKSGGTCTEGRLLRCTGSICTEQHHDRRDLLKPGAIPSVTCHGQ